jgi:hypothetical protein
MKRGFFLLVPLGLIAAASAQAPDVRVRVNLLYSLRSDSNGQAIARFYDVLGRRATVGLTTILESGFRLSVSQRFQRIANDPDTELFDEYFIEDEGSWRVGKQYAPFGSGRILREPIVAARGDTGLVFENVPVTVAVAQDVPGLPYGVVGRIGSKIGVSFAVGRFFGSGATSLNFIRKPEESPGRGRGYKQVFGVDASPRIGSVIIRTEAAYFRAGEDELDRDSLLLDLSSSFRVAESSLVIGVSHLSQPRATVGRFSAGFALSREAGLESLIRFSENGFYDASINLTVRF